MYPDIIAICIPFMIACVVIEFLYDMRRKKKNYRINAAISNISCGIFEQVTGFISKGLFALLYIYLYNTHRLYTIEDSLLVFIGLMLLVDLVFYGFHRLSHVCSVLWAGHVVHHEVEEFNLTVALRRSVMQEFTIISVYLPFAVLGFSPAAFFLIFAAHNLYQFLIHTSYLPEFRTFGLIFNTPYHHEIHHARNRCYVDKNFAGVLIIWDKMFGTFAKRTETPEIGIGQETTTLNPVTAQITTLARVFAEAKSKPSLRGKLVALFGPPSYLSKKSGAAADHAGTGREKFDPLISKASLQKAIMWFAFMLITITVYRNYETSLPLGVQLFALAMVGGLLFYIGLILDNKVRAAEQADAASGTEV
ncbi:sterol desaturase family protein [Rheinheimera baltica]|uniref:Sterol desaturase n=1 Tax=Rheinheimera sp. BAL341 TaxID=1708203 RepID=A0A486XTG9_9GAMM|nr:sterol desaturase family protein [Rheinheimera baltica]